MPSTKTRNDSGTSDPWKFLDMVACSAVKTTYDEPEKAAAEPRMATKVAAVNFIVGTVVF